jgi:TorA maturation chaperone TorD
MTQNDQNLAPYAGAEAFFGLLGKLLQNEPSDESINFLSKEGLFETLPYGEGNALVARGQAAMLAWLRDSGDVMDARADYMRLFGGIGSTVRPWGSYYLTNEKLSFHADTLVIREIYQRYGVEPVLKNKEPDDNIGFELEFVSYLLGKGELEAAKDFAYKHMRTWVGKWQADVCKQGKTDYYKGLAQMAAGGVEEFIK